MTTGTVIIYRAYCARSGKSYIGMTKNLAKRWRGHLTDARKARFRSAFHQAIRLYGADSFSIEICFEAATRAEAAAVERRLIVEYGTLAPAGYNMAPGGDGGPVRSGMKSSAETCRRISAGLTGKKLSPEHIEAVASKLRGRKMSPGRVAQLVLSGKLNRGKKRTEAHRIANAAARRRAMIQKAADRVMGVEWNRGKWVARIMREGQRRYIGRFSTREAAAEAYRREAAKHLESLLAQTAHQNTEPSLKANGSQPQP